MSECMQMMLVENILLNNYQSAPESRRVINYPSAPEYRRLT